MKGKKAFLFKSLTQLQKCSIVADDINDNNNDGGDNEEDEYSEDKDLGTIEVDIDSYNSSASDDS